jgi:hypothetical protein
MGWGSSGWGTGAWGLSSIQVTSAVAVATTTVQVKLSEAPPATSPTAAGDALNLATWAVERLDTSFSFTVAAIERIDSTTFDVHVLEPFGGVTVQHEVAASFSTTVGLFFGLLSDAASTPAAVAAARRFAQVDIANPQTPQSPSPGATLIILESGDYDTVSGSELVKKLIIRRVFTPTGGFFHLPDYGVGIALKEPIPINDLTKLKAEIERQARLEPEVEDVSVTLTVADNVLTIQLKAVVKPSGDRIEIVGSVPSQVVL